MKPPFKSLFVFSAIILALPVIAKDGEFEALFLNLESRKSVDSDYVAAVDDRLEIDRVILKDNQSYHLYFIRGEFQVSSVYRKEGKVYEQYCLVIERKGIELVRIWVEGISVQRISEHQNARVQISEADMNRDGFPDKISIIEHIGAFPDKPIVFTFQRDEIGVIRPATKEGFQWMNDPHRKSETSFRFWFEENIDLDEILTYPGVKDSFERYKNRHYKQVKEKTQPGGGINSEAAPRSDTP